MYESLWFLYAIVSDGDDTWNKDDRNGAVDLSVSSVAGENHLDHDITEVTSAWLLPMVIVQDRK